MSNEEKSEKSGTVSDLVAHMFTHGQKLGYMLEAHLNPNDGRTDAEIYKQVVILNDTLIVEAFEMFGIGDAQLAQESRERIERLT